MQMLQLFTVILPVLLQEHLAVVLHKAPHTVEPHNLPVVAHNLPAAAHNLHMEHLVAVHHTPLVHSAHQHN